MNRKRLAQRYTAWQLDRMIRFAVHSLGATPYDQITTDLVWAHQHTRRLGLPL